MLTKTLRQVHGEIIMVLICYLNAAVRIKRVKYSMHVTWVFTFNL